MFKTIARLGAAFIAAFTLSLPAAATTFSIDYSDLWGGGVPSPTESGWGLNLIQQGDVIFGTMFVYGSDSTARWFSVTLSGGPTSWSGALDQTTGSYYGTTWNSASVTHSTVGTMTVSFSSANSGSLTYNVGGVTVNKQISRFSLRASNLTGKYLGGMVATCPGTNGLLIFDTLNVTQNGSATTMTIDFLNSSSQQGHCTYNGTLTTTGRTGSIGGNYNCTYNGVAGNVGTFNVTNLEMSMNGFNGTYTGADQFCSSQSGRFGGVKDVQ